MAGGNRPRKIALTRIATSNVGIDRTVSATRIRRLSTQPPMKPAARPIVTPISIDTTTLASPISSEIRVP